jgi:hypothetical protein
MTTKLIVKQNLILKRQQSLFGVENLEIIFLMSYFRIVKLKNFLYLALSFRVSTSISFIGCFFGDNMFVVK